jgi:pimeloyl-ACP methyl ester carboxylesterase
MRSQPFTIAIPQSTLDDLHERLARTRWIDEAEEFSWEYGISLENMKELAHFWQHSYDWRKQEAALNTFAQFKTDVDGVGIHFIHERGKGPNPTPLLLIHGFPDSFYRYHKVIERLTDPAKYGCDPDTSFDVIVPSIPGTGFSDRVTMDDEVNADLFAKLMTEVLGYEHFVSAGGDHGAIITQSLARRYADLLIGIHLTDVGYPDQSTDFSTLCGRDGDGAVGSAVVYARRDRREHDHGDQAADVGLWAQRLADRSGSLAHQLLQQRAEGKRGVQDAL